MSEDVTAGGLQSGEPYWVVITKLTEEEWATAAVDAPNEEEAQAEAERIISSQEGTTDYDVKRVRGPFPPSPGEANIEARPHGCHGCGLHLWPAEEPPCPNSTWFVRDFEADGDIPWKCIQCGTRTHLPKEAGSA